MTRRNGYFYYERTEEGKQYTVHCRRVVKDESSTSTGGAWGSSLEQACCLPCKQCCCRCKKDVTMRLYAQRQACHGW